MAWVTSAVITLLESPISHHVHGTVTDNSDRNAAYSFAPKCAHQFGAGEYRLPTREGQTMVFSGDIGLAAALKL